MQFYALHIYLTKHCEHVAARMSQGEDMETMLSTIDKLQLAVTTKSYMSQLYPFSEDDPPSADVLSALLRGKHWAALGVTFRPCIKLILCLSFRLRCSEAGSAGRMATAYDELRPATIRRVESLPFKVWHYAREGIRALIESTRAFHGLEDRRPVLINAFGTAHA